MVFVVEFRPLVYKICLAPDLPEPSFQAVGDSGDECRVVVEVPQNSVEYGFVGACEGGFAASAERAAQKMVLHLVKQLGVRVDDLSLQLCEQYECMQTLFALRRSQLRLLEKRMPCLLVSEKSLTKETRVADPLVSIDFNGLLRKILAELSVSVTEIEYLKLNSGCYIAWMSVECPGTVAGCQWFESNQCQSAYGARECLSKKVIHSLMMMHRFKVVDVNYETLLRHVLHAELERESSFAVRERIYKFQADKEGTSSESAGLSVMPDDSGAVVGDPVAGPMLPRKRKQQFSSGENSIKKQGTFIPYGVVSRELNCLARRGR